MRIFQNISYLVLFGLIVSFSQKDLETNTLCKQNLDFASEQIKLLSEEASEKEKLPRALNKQGEIHWANAKFDWTEGFFPGTCWYLYEYNKNSYWHDRAKSFQSYYKEHRFLTSNHDLGFVFMNSFGKGYKLTGNKEDLKILIDAGNSLITRFNTAVGCIQSWDVDRGWQSKRNWQFPVIVDNMMNLEMLFELTEITGDNKYAKVARTHANTTMKNHFREDGGSYHVVDYDSISGIVRSRQTAQGFSDESAWARGQAWGLYGYTMCYRYTQDANYLAKAKEIALFLLNHEKMPEDYVPYWDFNAPQIPDEPRDASAAAIMASALIELSTYSEGDFLPEAKTILENLSSEKYQANSGENGFFILKHCVGSIPHGAEINVPLVYADYYYVEALMRLMNMEKEI